MLHSGGRHPPQAGAELKILIFGAGGSSIRPLGTISLEILLSERKLLFDWLRICLLPQIRMT